MLSLFLSNEFSESISFLASCDHILHLLHKIPKVGCISLNCHKCTDFLAEVNRFSEIMLILPASKHAWTKVLH